MDMWKTGRAHPASSNMMKYVGTELNKRRHELVMAGGGSEALEWDSEETKGGARPRGWLRTKANSIEGGTSEVMLTVIAKRILDLPGACPMPLYPNDDQAMLKDSLPPFLAAHAPVPPLPPPLATPPRRARPPPPAHPP